MALAAFKTKPSMGLGHIVLQFLRACSVITLLASSASCWILLIKIEHKRSWFPFEGASLFFLSCLPLCLVVSEFPMIEPVRNYFRRAWPAVGPEAGLTWLGTGMAVIGCNLLGKLNQPAFDAKRMGDPFRQLVMATGILNLILGVLNVLCSFLWSDSKAGISARQVRSDGQMSKPSSSDLPLYSRDCHSSSSSMSNEKFPNKYGKTNNTNGFMPNQYDAGNPYDGESVSPILPTVLRPPEAHHPANKTDGHLYQGNESNRAYRTSSRYPEDE